MRKSRQASESDDEDFRDDDEFCEKSKKSRGRPVKHADIIYSCTIIVNN